MDEFTIPPPTAPQITGPDIDPDAWSPEQATAIEIFALQGDTPEARAMILSELGIRPALLESWIKKPDFWHIVVKRSISLYRGKMPTMMAKLCENAAQSDYPTASNRAIELYFKFFKLLDNSSSNSIVNDNRSIIINGQKKQLSNMTNEDIASVLLEHFNALDPVTKSDLITKLGT